MSKNSIRLFYKNQFELGHALKNYIDEYFDNKVEQHEFESNIILMINSNRDMFFKDDKIAKKPEQILGKTRMKILSQIINERGVLDEKDSSTKQ